MSRPFFFWFLFISVVAAVIFWFWKFFVCENHFEFPNCQDWWDRLGWHTLIFVLTSCSFASIVFLYPYKNSWSLATNPMVIMFPLCRDVVPVLYYWSVGMLMLFVMVYYWLVPLLMVLFFFFRPSYSSHCKALCLIDTQQFIRLKSVWDNTRCLTKSYWLFSKWLISCMSPLQPERKLQCLNSMGLLPSFLLKIKMLLFPMPSETRLSFLMGKSMLKRRSIWIKGQCFPCSIFLMEFTLSRQLFGSIL